MYSEKWAGFGSYVQPDDCDKTIALMSNDEAMGTVQGGGIFPMDTTITISATPNVGHHFTAWSDGSTENPRTITVSGDATYTALFAINNYTLATNAFAMEGNALTHGSTAHLIALPQVNQQFRGWSNGATDNPLAVLVVSDTAINALYGSAVRDTILLHDTLVVYDTVINLMRDTTEYNHYYYDTMTYVSIDTLHHYYYDTTHTYHTLYDTTAVTHYVFDSTFVFDTTHATHYVFDSTFVFDTVYLFDTVHVHDTVYITQEGIGEATALYVRIYQSGSQLVVEGTEGQPVVLYDMTGRVLGKADEGVVVPGFNGTCRFDVPASGTYLVRIGHHPARKVVVIR